MPISDEQELVVSAGG